MSFLATGNDGTEIQSFALNWTKKYWNTLNYDGLEYTELKCTERHWTAPICTDLHCIANKCQTVYSEKFTELHWTKIHCTKMHCNLLSCTNMHGISHICAEMHCNANKCRTAVKSAAACQQMGHQCDTITITSAISPVINKLREVMQNPIGGIGP